MQLVTVVPGAIWLAQHPMRFFGLRVNAQMTVVRLADGALWLHSPVPCAGAVGAHLRALGEPLYIVAPNRFHHLYVEDCRRAFPRARLFVAPGLETKRADLAPMTVLGEVAPSQWARDLVQICVKGIPHLNEVVWVHRSTGTLLVTDLCLRLGANPTWSVRVLAAALGVRQLAMSRTMRLLVRDKAALRASVEEIRRHDFDRVIVAHEGLVETGGKAAFAAAMGWLER